MFCNHCFHGRDFQYCCKCNEKTGPEKKLCEALDCTENVRTLYLMTTRYMVRCSNDCSVKYVECSSRKEAKEFATHMRSEGYETLIVHLNVEAI